jgi:transcriptional regulator with XRE-family HTH domain
MGLSFSPDNTTKKELLMIGTVIKELREKQSLSKKDIAKYLDIEAPSVTNVENGRSNFSEEKLTMLAELFNIDVAILMKAASNKVQVNDEDYKIGKRVQFYRKQKGMTQAELGKFLGYSGSGPICYIEAGKRGMSRPQLLKCCELFNIHIVDLLSSPDVEHEQIYEQFMDLYKSDKKPASYRVIKDMIDLAHKELLSLR